LLLPLSASAIDSGQFDKSFNSLSHHNLYLLNQKLAVLCMLLAITLASGTVIASLELHQQVLAVKHQKAPKAMLNPPFATCRGTSTGCD
jgi:hypothetical protein